MITETWQWMVIVGECAILAIAPLLLIVLGIETRKRMKAGVSISPVDVVK